MYATASLTIAPDYVKARNRLLDELHRVGKGQPVVHNGDLLTDSNISLAIADAMEECIDDILARQLEIPEMKSGEVERLPDLKAQGNAFFADGRLSDALRIYLSTIRSASLSTGLVSILTNRALCYRQLKRPAEALQNAICAICCDPLCVKAHFHVASALSDLGQPMKAMNAATCGLQIDPRNFALLHLTDQLSKTTLACAGSKES